MSRFANIDICVYYYDTGSTITIIIIIIWPELPETQKNSNTIISIHAHGLFG
jgi:hypothetical protein